MGSTETIQTAKEVLTADNLLAISCGVGLAMAFTKKVRRSILQRDGGCTWDEDNSAHRGILEAAHINHTKGSKYDSPDNGRALCTAHHLNDHIDRAGENGLTPAQNDWAIMAIMSRLSRFLSENE